MHGAVIGPAFYSNALENALVEVWFSLTHWFIGARNGERAKDSYTADIVDILVLLPPPLPWYTLVNVKFLPFIHPRPLKEPCHSTEGLVTFVVYHAPTVHHVILMQNYVEVRSNQARLEPRHAAPTPSCGGAQDI